MPLYRVQVTYETVVVAKDKLSAVLEVRQESLEGEARSFNTTEIKDRNELPEPWTPNCRPYGDDRNTIAYYLK